MAKFKVKNEVALRPERRFSTRLETNEFPDGLVPVGYVFESEGAGGSEPPLSGPVPVIWEKLGDGWLPHNHHTKTGDEFIYLEAVEEEPPVDPTSVDVIAVAAGGLVGIAQDEDGNPLGTFTNTEPVILGRVE